jgi:hypothetical protein
LELLLEFPLFGHHGSIRKGQPIVCHGGFIRGGNLLGLYVSGLLALQEGKPSG